MVRLSKKTLLALEAVLDVAVNARPNPVQSKDITRRQGIPQRYLEQVMQQLVHAGVLKGVRGPKGGYRLALERRRISVGDIVRIVGEMEIADEPRETPSTLGEKVIGPMWNAVQNDMMEKLNAVSVEDLCLQAAAIGADSETKTAADFTI